MIDITLYRTAECLPCDQLREDLRGLQSEHPHRLLEIDITSDPALIEEYSARVPVLSIGPYTKTAPFALSELRITLGAARDRQAQLEKVGDPLYAWKKERAASISAADRISLWMSRHYLLAINLAVLIYVGLPFLAPVMMKAGWVAPATFIYRSYSLVCHNLAFRSWFLFGEQAAYPRAAAAVPGLEPFGVATGLSEGNTNSELLIARRYIGDERVGYKVAFCERDVAIYAGILLFGLLFGLTGRSVRGFPVYLWILIGLGPIGLDGFSQLLSQIQIGFVPDLLNLEYRESTPLLRTLTGGLFGFATAWFGLPLLEETFAESRRTLIVKFKRLAEKEAQAGL